jgi:hypothetical protein
MNTTLITTIFTCFTVLILGITLYNKQQLALIVASAEAGLEQCKSEPDFRGHVGIIWVKDCKTYIETIRKK